MVRINLWLSKLIHIHKNNVIMSYKICNKTTEKVCTISSEGRTLFECVLTLILTQSCHR